MADEMERTLREAGERRAQAARDRSGEREQRDQGIPLALGRSLPFASQLRAEKVQRDGKQWLMVEGYASAFEQPYEMWDWAGPYNEIVSVGAADATLKASPDVSFLVNHKGLSMARTAPYGGNPGTLELWADESGLGDRAWLNPGRQDVQDLALAIDDQVITEQSFAFMITSGQWSPDYTEYRINAFDLHRGDVSAVNYGANPHTSIAARSREIMRELDLLPEFAARAALTRLQARQDLAPEPSAQPSAGQRGRDIKLIEAMLQVG